MPYSGIGKAVQTISRGLLGSANPLKRALYAGALCEVCRHADDYAFTPSERLIHGRVLLPTDGYLFRIVEDNIDFNEYERSNTHLPSNHVSSNHGIVKSLLGIVQLLFACLTLYRSSGNQVELYGYAAFGLTVTQYAVASLVNLIANLVTPHYPSLFMVRRPKMGEAETKGGKFEGVMGDVAWERGNQERRITPRPMILFTIVIVCCTFAAPYCIIHALRKFQPGDSTKVQRGWTMA